MTTIGGHPPLVDPTHLSLSTAGEYPRNMRYLITFLGLEVDLTHADRSVEWDLLVIGEERHAESTC
jgi:hypothetical protein